MLTAKEKEIIKHTIEKDKVRFKDLSLPLKIVVIVIWIDIVVVGGAFFVGFLLGLSGELSLWFLFAIFILCFIFCSIRAI